MRTDPTGAPPRTPARSLAGTPAPRAAPSQARRARLLRHGIQQRRRNAAALALVLSAAAVLTGAACRQDMHDQPTYDPLEASAFFPDGSSARAPIEGTVARGHLRDDAALYTGRTNDALVTTLPVPLDERLVRRGREMFDAYCAPCHGRTGDANGMIVQRGFTRPPSLFEPRLRELPHGHIFEVITNGFGAMPDHAAQIQVLDRWAIVAYVRALQLSASASIADVPPAERARLER